MRGRGALHRHKEIRAVAHDERRDRSGHEAIRPCGAFRLGTNFGRADERESTCHGLDGPLLVFPQRAVLKQNPGTVNSPGVAPDPPGYSFTRTPSL